MRFKLYKREIAKSTEVILLREIFRSAVMSRVKSINISNKSHPLYTCKHRHGLRQIITADMRVHNSQRATLMLCNEVARNTDALNECASKDPLVADKK